MKTLMFTLMTMLILFSSVGIARDFPTIWGEWTWGHVEPVHVMVAPGCYAQELLAADYFGPIPTDGTVRIQLWIQEPGTNPPPPYPLANYPREDIWLEFPGATACLGGTLADDNSDSEGWITFSRHLEMGGSNDPSGSSQLSTVKLLGLALRDQNGQFISPDIAVNSPDINGDLVTDLLDLSLFASDFFGSYAYRSDFFWDGAVNLADLASMAHWYGCECP
jgi:hypothetical protein